MKLTLHPCFAPFGAFGVDFAGVLVGAERIPLYFPRLCLILGRYRPQALSDS
jgi:hypothetical protein